VWFQLEPRSFQRGIVQHTSFLNDGQDMLQWSRARSSAEFPARDSHQVGVAIASMEPCSFEHGIEIAIGGGGGSYTELQWSRARSSAEYSAFIQASIDSRLLQWSRARSSAE
jgi:hypothetical protein